MAARNGILLIVKQQPGIEYNVLLNKIAGNYGGIESARAALSRSVRYLAALGFIVRKGNSLFATGKGEALLNSEMQNKLLFRLNELLGKKDAMLQFEKAVELMQTLIERSKQDKDLLVAAKASADFYISNLGLLEKEAEERIHRLGYLHGVFGQQINALKELDFPDYRQLPFSKETKGIVRGIAKKTGAKVFTAECPNEAFRQKAMAHFSAKSRQNDIFLEARQIGPFLNLVENSLEIERNAVNLFIAGIKIKINYPYVFVTAPYRKLQELLGEK
jgi:hypothetical protein